MNQNATFSFNQATGKIDCLGAWNLAGMASFSQKPLHTRGLTRHDLAIDGSQISDMDSAGAFVLSEFIQSLEKDKKKIQLVGFSQEHAALLTLVALQLENFKEPKPVLVQDSFVTNVGKMTAKLGLETMDFVAFFGETLLVFWKTLFKPGHIQWRSFWATIDETGYRALGIVGLLCFLIGVVLAYQMGQQIKLYGANVYIVGLLGVGILQEFAPLITAIIVAGRTSSAFTAQLGTMQINEEIDALRTMGLSPIERLVLPKVFGLIISLPLLVVWADIFGLAGGMIVSKHMLGISFYNFLLRFPHVIEPSTFLYGLIKAPVFAVIISGVGCFQGFRVTSTADSVGWQTTKSVVQAIFLIIVADALFSIILPWQTI